MVNAQLTIWSVQRAPRLYVIIMKIIHQSFTQVENTHSEVYRFITRPEQPIQKYSYPRYVIVEINDFILTLKNAISSSRDYRDTKAVRIRKTKP